MLESFQQLQLTLPGTEAEEVADLLLSLGATSVTFLDPLDEPIFEPKPDEVPLWSRVRVQALFLSDQHIDFILPLLQTEHAIEDVKISVHCDEEAWELKNQQYPPLYFANRLQVCAELRDKKLDQNFVSLLLPPGLGFGTGTHPTTALCLEWLAENIRGGEVVADYGCGSGILSLAALKLGAAKAYAMDYDPQALQATANNAKANDLSMHQVICSVDATDVPKVDIVLANILADTLIELAPTLSALLKPHGHLILSGVLETQQSRVWAAYETNFILQSVRTKDEWVFMHALFR